MSLREYRIMAISLFLAAATSTMLSCGSDGLRAKYTVQPEHDHVARFLAGRTLPAQSRLYPLTQKSYYQRYQLRMEKIRAQIIDRHVSQIAKWQTENGFNPTSDSAVYPLSGADVTNLITFFPNCSQYLMVALQPANEFSDPAAMTETTLERSLAQLRDTVSDISERNYFRSTVLRSSQKNAGLPGIAPIILTFLSMLDKVVLSYEFVYLSADGTIQKIGAAAPTGPTGLRVYFQAPGETQVHALVYLAITVSPEFASLQLPTGKLLISMGRVNLLLKAAIYLFHENQYAGLATTLLQKSDLIVQDDSGIPYRLFPQADWKFAPFGLYKAAARLNDLKWYPAQTELRELYNTQAKAMNFSFGYGTWSGRSNLLWATRIKHKS
jgi:hypothetical protein